MNNMTSFFILTLLLSVFYTDRLQAQKWEKKNLPFEARLVHAMTANASGCFITGGRLAQGGRSDEMISISGDSIHRYAIKKPTARDGHSLVTSLHGELLMFGGNTSDGPVNELWKYDDHTWKLIIEHGDTVPMPRWGHAAVYFDKKYWIFGGKGSKSGEFYQDLWTWDGNRWELKESILKPAPRYGVQLGIYRNKVFLYGGRDHSGNWFTDTWIWDNGWQQIVIDSALQQPRASVGFSLISAKEDLFLIGGIFKGDSFPEMWKWSGKYWKLVNKVPFILDFPAGCFDPVTNLLVVSGSSGNNFEYWNYLLN